jgi:hypothetical protein
MMILPVVVRAVVSNYLTYSANCQVLREVRNVPAQAFIRNFVCEPVDQVLDEVRLVRHKFDVIYERLHVRESHFSGGQATSEYLFTGR